MWRCNKAEPGWRATGHLPLLGGAHALEAPAVLDGPEHLVPVQLLLREDDGLVLACREPHTAVVIRSEPATPTPVHSGV